MNTHIHTPRVTTILLTHPHPSLKKKEIPKQSPFAVSSRLSVKVLMPVTRSAKTESQTEEEKITMSSFSALQQYSNKQYTKKIFSQTHTLTHKKNQLLPKSLLYVGSVYVFLGVCVCMCVGSAVPPGCPETNWQLEKLWLQGKVSEARDGDKEERGER